MQARRTAALAALFAAAALAVVGLVANSGASRGHLAGVLAAALGSSPARGLRSTNQSDTAAANASAAARVNRSVTRSGEGAAPTAHSGVASSRNASGHEAAPPQADAGNGTHGVPGLAPVAHGGGSTHSGAGAMARADHGNGTKAGGAQPPANATTAPAFGAHSSPCLCIFDVDRTLTGKQWQSWMNSHTCPGNLVKRGVWDPAYGGGDLTLSDLGQHVQQSFCGGCYLGVVSAGNAGGWQMKQVIHGLLKGAHHLENRWSGPNPVTSPLVIGCHDEHKPACARGVIEWYHHEIGVSVATRDVYFFDDKRNNVKGVASAGFNAHQVSCVHRRRRRRKYNQGFCGGRLSEVEQKPGMTLC